MGRRAFIGSYLLFNFVMISLLWGDRWLPPVVGIVILGCVVVGWFVSAHFLFRYLQLPVRVKIAGWAFVVAFVGYSVARRFSSYYLYHDAWSLMLYWDGIRILFIAASIGVAILVVPRSSSVGRNSASFTVESEAPDHVLHVEGTPNYSLKRTAADRLV